MATSSPFVPVQQGHIASLQDGLDFINTVHFSRLKAHDHLESPEAALDWLCQHDLLHAEAKDARADQFRESPSEGARMLAKLRRLRAAMRGLLEATAYQRTPAAADLAELNHALRTHYIYELVPAPDGVSLGHRHQGDPVDGAMTRLAESIARALIQGHAERLRVCQAADCHWVFADTSRTGRRKWCDMASCGNRAKVARHRARRQGLTATPLS
jgi:predicted RNA-binding Zn ribbon-like protein